jgi:hypothetical protein
MERELGGFDPVAGDTMKTPRNTPHHPDTHLIEREHIRRIRRHRPLGDTSTPRFPVLVRTHESLLGSLRDLCRRLEADRDSYEAWVGLSRIFDALKDVERSELCREIAQQLKSLSSVAGSSSHN